MIKLANKTLIFSIISIIVFYLVFSLYSDFSLVLDSFSLMKVSYIPLVLLSISTALFIKGIRQYYLLKSNKIHIPLKKNFIIYLSGLSLVFTPGGVGETIKTKFLKNNFNVPIKNSFPIIIMEKYYEALAYIIIIAFTLFTYNEIVSQIALVLGIIFLVIIYINFRYEKLLDLIKIKLSKIKFFKDKVQNQKEFSESLKRITTPDKMFVGTGLSLIAVLFELLAIVLIFAAFGINLDFILISQISLVSLLFGYISFLPNGIGVTDASFIGLLVNNNISIASATVVVFTTRFIGLWFKTGIGVLTLRFVKEKNLNDN